MMIQPLAWLDTLGGSSLLALPGASHKAYWSPSRASSAHGHHLLIFQPHTSSIINMSLTSLQYFPNKSRHSSQFCLWYLLHNFLWAKAGCYLARHSDTPAQNSILGLWTQSLIIKKHSYKAVMYKVLFATELWTTCPRVPTSCLGPKALSFYSWSPRPGALHPSFFSLRTSQCSHVGQLPVTNSPCPTASHYMI